MATVAELIEQREALWRKREELNREIAPLSREIKRLQRAIIDAGKAEQARASATRNAAIYKARAGGATLRTVGEQFGLSVERVRGIVAKIDRKNRYGEDEDY